MKLSKFNYKMRISEDKNIMYNTLSRKYIVYKDCDEEFIDSLLSDLKKPYYTKKEADIAKQLISNGIIIDDGLDELDKLKFEEDKNKFQDDVFSLVIQPTLDCNFRCVYCYEEHKKLRLDNDTSERIVKLVRNVTKKVKKLQVAWFGGEPMMEFERMLELTNKFKNICEENNCKYIARITTNGYLFSEEVIDKLDELSIKKIQITVDGPKEYHDKKRPLANGKGSFDRIKENIIELLEKDILLTLRMNVDEENYKHIHKLFEIIPDDKKHKVVINMANIFKNKGKLNLYELYKKAIDEGFIYYNTVNSMVKCEASMKNSITIQPDGKVVFCSVAGENGENFGLLGEEGNIKFKNPGLYYKFQNTSTLEREMCRNCIKLPMCMGGCKYGRFKNNKVCNGLRPNGLSIEEEINLHYYSDTKLNEKEGVNII